MPMHAPAATTERDCLLGFLNQQRNAAKAAAYGLTDAQAAAAPTASSLTVGGLLKHLTQVERHWTAIIRQEVGAGTDFEAYLAGFRFEDSDTVADVIDEYDAAIRATDDCIVGLDLDHAVPVPKGVPWFPDDVEAWTLRWVVLHLVEETARHAGHADIVRESIDGAASGALLAAVEGWQPTPWLQPWQPVTVLSQMR